MKLIALRRVALPRFLSVAALMLVAIASAVSGQAPVRPAEYAVVIMIDGLRPDALRRSRAPHLKKLAADGATYLQARTIYPSQTRVAFVSLPTGAYPGSHGIIGGDDFKDGEWQTISLGADGPGDAQALCARPTIFEELTAAGMTSAYVAMKGYELVGAKGATRTINGAKTLDSTSFRLRYAREAEGSAALALWHKQRLSRQLLDQTLDLYREYRPNFLIVNLGSADYVAHTYGPGGSEYPQTIEFIDGLVGELLETLKTAGTLDRTAIIVSADHGFTDVGTRVILETLRSGETQVPELAKRGIVHHVTNTGGTSMGLYLQDDARTGEAIETLRAQPWTESIFCAQPRSGCDRALGDLHAYFPGRSPDLMVDVDDDSSLTALGGNHGSLRENDMRIPLIFSGAGVVRGAVFGKAQLIDIAPTVLRLLGVESRILRPDGRVLSEVLAR